MGPRWCWRNRNGDVHGGCGIHLRTDHAEVSPRGSDAQHYRRLLGLALAAGMVASAAVLAVSAVTARPRASEVAALLGPAIGTGVLGATCGTLAGLSVKAFIVRQRQTWLPVYVTAICV